MNDRKIAKQTILVVAPDGVTTAPWPFGKVKPSERGIKLDLAIGVPQGEPSATCKIYFGRNFEPRRIVGVDKWQALLMATKEMYRALKQFDDAGWQFEFYDKGVEFADPPATYPTTLKELFSGIGIVE